MISARIALDAMGGDRAPRETVRGALDALARDDGLAVTLVGEEQAIRKETAAAEVAGIAGRLQVVHASQVVGGGDAAAAALRLRDSSIRRGAELVQAQEVDGMVAAGNTGAAVAASTIVIRLLPGVRRPGIAVTLPTASGQTVLCDAGANIHCKPLHLFHYGIMARQYCRVVYGIPDPTIGLLNIGSEEGKGTDLVKETASLFGGTDLNFIGNVEGNDVFSGRCDVVVCEGFVGNVVLKTAEGLYEVIASRLEEVARVIARPSSGGPTPEEEALRRFRLRMDWAEYGGAPLLGLNGLVLISHGRSDARAIRNAILQAASMHRKKVLAAMVSDLEADARRSAS